MVKTVNFKSTSSSSSNQTKSENVKITTKTTTTTSSGKKVIAKSTKPVAKTTATTTTKTVKAKPAKPVKVTIKKNNTRVGVKTGVAFSPSKYLNHIKKLHWTKHRILVAVLIVLLCLIHIVSTASPVWLAHYGIRTQGLWRICYEKSVDAGLSCERYESIPYDFKWVQAFMTVAMALNCLNVMYFACMLRLKWPYVPLTISLEAAALMTLIALAIFTACYIELVQQSAMFFGWCYFLGWVTVVIAVVIGVILFQEDSKK